MNALVATQLPANRPSLCQMLLWLRTPRHCFAQRSSSQKSQRSFRNLPSLTRETSETMRHRLDTEKAAEIRATCSRHPRERSARPCLRNLFLCHRVMGNIGYRQDFNRIHGQDVFAHALKNRVCNFELSRQLPQNQMLNLWTRQWNYIGKAPSCFDTRGFSLPIVQLEFSDGFISQPGHREFVEVLIA